MVQEVEFSQIGRVNNHEYFPGTIYIDFGDEVEFLDNDGILQHGEVTEPLGHSVEVDVYQTKGTMKIRNENRMKRNKVKRLSKMQMRKGRNLASCECCHPRRFRLCWEKGNLRNAEDRASLAQLSN